MHRSRRALAVVAVALAGVLVGGTVTAAGPSDQWVSAGHDLHNTRNQENEHKIGVGNVAGLQVKWAFTTGGDVSATPAVDGTTVYVPDWAGNLFAVDRKTGQEVWRASIPAASGVPGDKARATPAITGNKVIVGTQGLSRRRRTKMLAFNKNTGALLWSTTIESHFASIVTQSAMVHGEPAVRRGVVAGGEPGRLHTGLHLLHVPRQHARPRRQHRRDRSGRPTWPPRATAATRSGGARRRSTRARPGLHRHREQLLGSASRARLRRRLPRDDPVRERPACRRRPLRRDHGARPEDRARSSGSTQALPFDAWTVDCIPILVPTATNCPDPAGPDYDFGQAPALFTVAPTATASRETWSAPARRAASTGRSTPTPAPSCG